LQISTNCRHSNTKGYRRTARSASHRSHIKQ
jgi:hypothetical protein